MATEQGLARILLSHGAGAGSDSDFMQQLACALESLGLVVCLWDFPYMVQAKLLHKKRPPDRMPVLLEALRQKVATFEDDLPLFLAGKSMGGRVSSMLLDELSLAGIAYGYPFHPIGKTHVLRVEHLQALQQPLLIVQGERDGFGHFDEVSRYSLSEQVSLQWLPDGDHSFKPRKASGFHQQDHIQTAAKMTLEFVERCLT